jgi:uncharacterized protein YggE
MKGKPYLMVGMLLMAVLVSACSGIAAAQTPQPGQVIGPARTISVTGSGKAFIVPDMAMISVGVRTENRDAGEAVEDNNAQTQEVIAALRDMGVAEQDIQTTNFSIYPQQQYDDQGQLTGTIYVVENTVQVTVRDLDQLGDLLGAAVDAGANSIYGIQFDVENKEEALSEARQNAVDDAAAQAQDLAQAAGVQLREIQSLSTVSSFQSPIFDGRGGAAEAAVSTVPISPGQLTVNADVTVVYTLE